MRLFFAIFAAANALAKIEVNKDASFSIIGENNFRLDSGRVLKIKF